MKRQLILGLLVFLMVGGILLTPSSYNEVISENNITDINQGFITCVENIDIDINLYIENVKQRCGLWV